MGSLSNETASKSLDNDLNGTKSNQVEIGKRLRLQLALHQQLQFVCLLKREFEFQLLELPFSSSS